MEQPQGEDASETLTPKGSDFIHRGFNDLLAMLPTGSGTGASAFFTSTHDGSIDGSAEDGAARDLPSSPIETPSSMDKRSQSSAWFWGHMMGDAARGDSSRRDATKTNLEKVTTHQPTVKPLMIPSQIDGEIIATTEGFARATTALRELPATPTTARTSVSETPVTRQSPSRSLPVPGVFPTRPSSTLVRSPLSPSISLTMAPMATLEMKWPAAPKTKNLPRVPIRQAILEESACSPLVADLVVQSPKNMKKPAKERRSFIPEGVLGSPMVRGKRATGAGAVASGKIDKRLISWPMDFRETPFQTLRVVNGMPSSVYSPTEGSDPRITTPGLLGNNSAKSPFHQIPNPFESAFSRPTSQHAAAMEGGLAENNMTSPSKITPLRVKARKPVPPVVTATFPLRQPMTVAPEEIDGLPFPSTPTIVREETEIADASQYPAERPRMDTTLEGFSSPAFIARVVQPSLPTLEKAASTAIFFETLYHALLKPPQMLQAAHPDNYACARERRRLALEEEMNKRGLPEQDRETLRNKWAEEETANLRERRRKVGLNSFTKLKVIGHGAFGVVSLVKAKETGALFAMKEDLASAEVHLTATNFSSMLRKGQEGHVRAEKDLLAAAANASDATSRWIVKLHYSFQSTIHEKDIERLYLILDFEGGGDLLNLLVERDTFDENFTRFYVAEMILALEATHKLGFIHRDVKPDNFLFSKDGHLKISDFGLANSLHWAYDTAYYDQQRRALLKRHGIDLEEPSKTKVRTLKRREVEALLGQEWLDRGQGMLTWRDNKRRKMAFSICGTNSYMSPEVIRGMGYGFSCDWWSLGVIGKRRKWVWIGDDTLLTPFSNTRLAFECLYGYPPFVSNSRHLTRQKILNWRDTLRFPTKPKVSRDCTDFLTKLLCEPEDRLGSMATSSTNRPNSIMFSERNPEYRTKTADKVGLGDDGAAQIKAHPWFKKISWDSIHLEMAPYQPNLRKEDDTRHFEDGIADEPLCAPGGGPADVTRDPMLADKKHGAELLRLRKGMAFAGWTYKANKQIVSE
ncbi:hypothetical protein QFC22_000329 [Naganishia vaughanmartiniae]|uniref:Uncharacterized protein n=1 Tax=Naganishia vaughanmartiniae TaxID=1424756 RepID=A0ACC2XPT2_9TREE|nr:hypothetical protein QFC22_000329 [Naganishia vaughanmartiniae]